MTGEPAAAQESERTEIETAPDSRGTEIDSVVVTIDYAIVKHFSDHLYGSPNKAVEELVANSYDAWATRSYVYMPGEYAGDSLLVWDDGESMDQRALHRLWWIAKSPKQDGSDRVEEREGRGKRALLGKFGIGKLASYALGHRITHLCRQGPRFLRVTVDYRNVPEIEEDGPEPRYEIPIVELDKSEAREYIESLSSKKLRAVAEFWDSDHWTLAVIDELKPGVALPPGRLRWVLSNGMPLRPDFKVYVDDHEIEPRVLSGALATWNLGEKKLQSQISVDWKEAVDKGDISGSITFEKEEDTDAPIAVFPELGAVKADVSLFRESLLKGRSTDLDRSYGYFVLVRGRLLNPDDPLLLMHDPSYGTFYRTQFVIHADGLDAQLLADRERVQRDSLAVRELAILQASLYRAARHELQEQDSTAELEQRSESLLPVQSREHFGDPLTALLLAHDSSPTLDPSSTRIERKVVATDQSLAALDLDGKGFVVNTAHPLFSAVSGRLGGGQKAKEALRVLDLLAVADLLLEGHLYDIGLDGNQIENVMAWRDGLLRAVAGRLVGARDDIVHDVREASYRGHMAFETALARLFEAMGFVAHRDGLPGKKDVLVIAPIGTEEYRFTVEAKGSHGRVANDDAEIAGAASHCLEAQATIAVVVAREFGGFEKPKSKEWPAVLQECDATGGCVTIATVEVLVELYEAMRSYAYPLDMVLPVLRVVETPADKIARVERLQHPTADFDFRGVLDAIWAEQLGRASGDLVAYRSVMQSRDEWKELGFTEFEQRLLALQILARGLMLVSRNRSEILLKQNPSVVAEQIQRSVEEGASRE